MESRFECNEIEIVEVSDEDEIRELGMISDYEVMMDEREHLDLRYQQWEDAIHHEVVDLVCPHCGEELWYELGYLSLYEMLLWEQFYYQRGMDSASHYRRP